MDEIFPSDIEAAFRAGQIDEPTKQRAMRNLQMQTNYLPIRYAQTWWHMMEETVDDIVKQSNERSFPVAAGLNTLSLLGALYAPISAAAKELSRPVDGFLIDMGASPQMARTARGVGEFVLNLVPAERIVSAAGGLKEALKPGRVAEVVKIVKEAGKEAPKVIRSLTPGAQARVAREAVGLREVQRIEAEALFDHLISPNGQQAVRLATTQSDELQRIMAEGERAQVGKGAVVASQSKVQAVQREEELLTPMIKSLDEQARDILARDKALREGIAQRTAAAEVQGTTPLVPDTGVNYAEIQAQQLQQMRDELSGYLQTRKAQAGTSQTLEAAAETVRGKEATATQKTLEAAQATMLGRNIPRETLQNLENMRQRLVDKGCL